MDYREYPPHPSLRLIVRCYWTLSVPQNAPDPPAPALPDGCPELILNFADPICATTPAGAVEAQPTILLVGQITRPFLVAPTGRVEIVAVRFSPFGASMLYPGLSRLTNHWTNAAELHPTLGATWPKLSRIGAAGHRIAHMDEVMRELIGGCPPPNPLVMSAVERITACDGALEIAHIADELGTTARHLQRLFSRYVGISPKLLSRIRRFQRVFSAWRDERGHWAQVAVSCGYFDQAHLVRDFSELGGGPPAGLLASLPEFTRAFTALARQRTAAQG